MRSTLAALALAASFALAAPSYAGGPGDSGAFQFNLGWYFPSGNSEFWDANEQAFTLDHSDFNSITLGFGYVASLTNHIEFGAGIDFYYHSQGSADRNFTDQNGFPILHDTRLSLTPVTFDVRFLPTGRYVQASPNPRYHARHPVPYLGLGVGFTYWQYEEEGDFVATDNTIVYDRFKESGTAFEKHVLGGLEIPVSPAWYIYFEGRYSWQEATPGGVFTTINPGSLDLGGASLRLGGSWRF
jgi:opacity protein-like surface antigen